MPVWQLNDQLIFPNPQFAEPDGMLAIGTDFSIERILLAYRSGIFPWFCHDSEFYWFSPDPRCILFMDDIVVSKSMQQLIKKNNYQIKVDTNFSAVMLACALVERKHDNETWIDEKFIRTYTELHKRGIAHSIEVYEGDELVGGLYGLSIGASFVGESMFSKKSNTSKLALIYLAQQLKQFNYHFIDCQVYNEHLGSMGAKKIPRDVHLVMLKKALENPPDKCFASLG